MRRLLSIFVFTAVTIRVAAQPISEQQALNRVIQHLTTSTPLKARSLAGDPSRLKSAKVEANSIYAFNVDGGGFVIASADSRALPVLGYSSSGSINWEQMPDNMRGWLKSYDKAIATLGNTNDFVDGISIRGLQKKRAPKAAIEPLIKSRWYQLEPYWNDCPLYEGANPDWQGKRCVVGCVATAMAQVMNYYQWPVSACKEIPGYSQTTAHENVEKIWNLDALPPVTFDWKNMADRYNSQTSEIQNKAVATLMRYCGQSVYMNYTPEGSGSDHQQVIEALVKYFGYDDAAHSANRVRYTIDEWEDLIYGELAEGHPVQYGGESDKEGHSFVCDGYDGNGFFHINWGWDGKSDNYFSLSVLNPYNNTSVGASSSSIGFCMNQMANIGVKPAPDGYSPEKVIPESYLWEHDPINVFSADSVYFQYVFMSYSYDEILVDFALGTREADDTLTPLYKGDPADSIVYNLSGNYHVVKIDSTLFAPGDCQVLYPMVKFYNLPDCEWQMLGSTDFHVTTGRTPEGQFFLYKDVPQLKISHAAFTDNPARAGSLNNITLTIRNKGEQESTVPLYLVPIYFGAVTPKEITSDTEYNEGDPMVSGAYLRPGEDTDVTFSFKPMGAGTVLLMLALGDGSFLDNCFVTVADSISSSIMSPIYRQTTITSTDRQTVAPYIDLQGRHLQGLPPRKGIYIRKGRKVIFRNP